MKTLVKARRHSITDLRRLLSYDPELGALMWNERTAADMRSGKASEVIRWNNRYAGKPAMTACNNGGYPTGAIHRTTYLAHIIAWAIYFGDWPEMEIDHINGIQADYRIRNLRSVTRQQNNQNRAKPKNNTTGIIGVSFCARDNLWIAHIQSKSIGWFKDRNAAIAARADAQMAAGFHANHGRELK